MIIGRVVAIVLQSFLQCFMLCSLFLQLFLILCITAVPSFHDLYAPWIPLGIFGVKGVSLDPELSS